MNRIFRSHVFMLSIITILACHNIVCANVAQEDGDSYPFIEPSLEEIKKQMEGLEKNSEEYIKLSGYLADIEDINKKIDQEKANGAKPGDETISSLHKKIDEKRREIRKMLSSMKNNVPIPEQDFEIAEHPEGSINRGLDVPNRGRPIGKNKKEENSETENYIGPLTQTTSAEDKENLEPGNYDDD